MKLRLTTITIGPNGAQESVRTDFDKRQILVGRGPNADIRVESRLVSLKHMVFYDHQDSLIVEDFGSFSGVMVNGVAITRQSISRDDRVTIGEFTFIVVSDRAPFEIALTIDKSQAQDLRSLVAADLRRVSPARQLAKIKWLSIFCVLSVLIVFGVLPLSHDSRATWNPGPLARPHRTLASKCSACHSENFKAVEDSRCLDCHQLSEHSELSLDHGLKCVNCHSEHRGNEGLSLKDSQRCVSCHGNIEGHINGDRKASVKNIISLNSHPVMPGDCGSAVKGPRNLKFNHSVHMPPDLATRESTETLRCSGCHELGVDGIQFRPITFERDCHRCHSLEFEEKLPGKEVPHGDARLVYQTLLRSEKNLSEPLRSLEEKIFNTTHCNLCHEVKRRGQEVAHASRFEIVKPHLDRVQNKDSRRIHVSHQAMACVSCHTNAESSESSSDVLLPSIAACQSCHSEEREDGLVPSPCSLCHSYHDSLKFDSTKPRVLESPQFY